jgi:hypothetical protein
VERDQRGRWRRVGGIAGLAELIADHGGALEYDLLTKAHMTLDDLGGALPARALLSFVRHLDHTSALWRATRDDSDEWVPWLDGTMVAPMLANLVDVTNFARWEYALSCTKKGRSKPRKPRRIDVPWRRDRSGERHIGSDPIPIAEFEEWWESKGAESRGEE